MRSHTLQEAIEEAERSDMSVPVPFPYSNYDWKLYTGSNIDDFEDDEVVLMTWNDYEFDFMRVYKPRQGFLDRGSYCYYASSEGDFDTYIIYRHVNLSEIDDEIEVLSSDLNEVL